MESEWSPHQTFYLADGQEHTLTYLARGRSHNLTLKGILSYAQEERMTQKATGRI